MHPELRRFRARGNRPMGKPQRIRAAVRISRLPASRYARFCREISRTVFIRGAFFLSKSLIIRRSRWDSNRVTASERSSVDARALQAEGRARAVEAPDSNPISPSIVYKPHPRNIGSPECYSAVLCSYPCSSWDFFTRISAGGSCLTCQSPSSSGSWALCSCSSRVH